MTKRLQVLLDDEELAEIQALARRRGQTTAALVRDALRAARATADYPAPETRLRAIREAVAHSYPIADIDELLGEIERGYQPAPASDADAAFDADAPSGADTTSGADTAPAR